MAVRLFRIHAIERGLVGLQFRVAQTLDSRQWQHSDGWRDVNREKSSPGPGSVVAANRIYLNPAFSGYGEMVQ